MEITKDQLRRAFVRWYDSDNTESLPVNRMPETPWADMTLEEKARHAADYLVYLINKDGRKFIQTKDSPFGSPTDD